MDPPSPATKKKTKEKARKAAQKKVKKKAQKKAQEKAASTSRKRNQSASRPVGSPTASVPPSYLSTFSASSATQTRLPRTSTDLPAALLAEPVHADDPGWLKSKKAVWAQAQKNVCIRWVQAKRKKVAYAEEALAAGRGSDAEVEVG
jgi:hypothetical protein